MRVSCTQISLCLSRLPGHHCHGKSGFQITEVALAQSRSQRPRSFWLATGIATSGQVQLWKSAIYGLPVTLRMLRVKSDKSDWFWSRSIVFTKPFKTRISLDLARGPDFSSACQKGPLGTRLALAKLQNDM